MNIPFILSIIHFICNTYLRFAAMNDIEELLTQNGRGRPAKYGFYDIAIHEACIFEAKGENLKDGRPTRQYANKVSCAAVAYYGKKGQKVARRIKGADVYIIRVA